jgi:acyl-CoA synthetase (AMP-forming)/AMP-acid ligase II
VRLIDQFDRSARAAPDRLCIVDGQSELTYESAWQLTCACAGLLADTPGGGPGTRIGVLAPNCADALVAILAVLRLGGVWVPVNSRADPAELSKFLAVAQCEILLTHESFWTQAAVAVRNTSCRLLPLPTADQLLRAGMYDCSHLSRQPYSMADVCTIFSTGGTTGEPKAARWTHRTWQILTANFQAGIHHDSPPRYLVAAPLTHAAGAVFFALLPSAGTTYLIPRAEPEAVMQSIQRHGITTLFLPPTVIYMMLSHPDLDAFDFSSLQNFIYAAAPMSEAKLRLAMRVFGPIMVQTYGQAEAPMVCTILTRHDHIAALNGFEQRLASCGRPALFTDVAIAGEDGALLAAGQTGEIVVRGELVMQGYNGEHEATPAAKLNGWHSTGDIGHRDADGYIYITDRKRDMIITGGFNVFPSEIEQVLWTHPAVRDCAVVGAPDEKWGEAVIAVVELKDGAKVAAEELISLCKAMLGSVKAPKRVLFWGELPRSGAGKVLKRDIRETLWAGHARKI